MHAAQTLNIIELSDREGLEGKQGFAFACLDGGRPMPTEEGEKGQRNMCREGKTERGKGGAVPSTRNRLD